MKRITLFLFTTVFAGITCFISCKKEYSCEGCEEKNQPPTAMAGPDQVITLPTDSVSLDGSVSSDPDGTISEWLWKKIAGPASFNIANASVAKSIIKNLATGTYQFELTVKDNGGLSAKDTIQVTVNSTTPINHPPVANAGADQTITLPTNTVNLDGSGSTDPDNNITGYLWTKISGPTAFNITNANTVQTQVINLVQGLYTFELKVTDAGALFSKDTLQISVNAQPPPECLPTNRPIINAQLIPIGNLSIGRRNMATVTAGNKLFFAGGLSASGLSSRVDIYDIPSQTWSTAELSIPRGALSAVAAGDKVFFAGGDTILYTTSHTSRVDIYNLTTQTWSIAELSQARSGIVTATVNNKVFFAGGAATNGYGSSVVDIYDISANTWSTANLSEAKVAFTATTVNDKIYFAGGDLGDLNTGPTSTKIDIYDVSTNTWSTSNLIAPKAYHAAIFKNGKIYWAGGLTYFDYQENEGWLTCQVEVKDANTQVSSSTNLSYPSQDNEAFEKDNKIVFISLFFGSQQWQDFDIYDLSSNSWSVGILPQIMSTRASIISLNNTIYVAGGYLCYSNAGCQFLSQVWRLEF